MELDERLSCGVRCEIETWSGIEIEMWGKICSEMRD